MHGWAPDGDLDRAQLEALALEAAGRGSSACAPRVSPIRGRHVSGMKSSKQSATRDWCTRRSEALLARQFLASKHIADEAAVQVILTLSGRLPLWLATLADARQHGNTDIGDAVERFLKMGDRTGAQRNRQGRGAAPGPEPGCPDGNNARRKDSRAVRVAARAARCVAAGGNRGRTPMSCEPPCCGCGAPRHPSSGVLPYTDSSGPHLGCGRGGQDKQRRGPDGPARAGRPGTGPRWPVRWSAPGPGHAGPGPRRGTCPRGSCYAGHHPSVVASG